LFNRNKNIKIYFVQVFVSLEMLGWFSETTTLGGGVGTWVFGGSLIFFPSRPPRHAKVFAIQGICKCKAK
jgi:hypothetical protein